MATVIAGSSKRALPWARPRGIRYIPPVELGIERLEQAVEHKKGTLYRKLASSPVFRHDDDDTERTRRMRSDGLRNLVSLFQTLVAAADMASGFVGSPRGEGSWERHTWGVLDARAYGARVVKERSFRRTQRHARILAALGLVDVAELKIPAGPGKWRSVVAIKRLTAAAYELLGLAGAVARIRRERDRKRGEQRVKELGNVVRMPAKPIAPAARPSAPMPPTAPATRPGTPTKDPPPAAESIAAAKAILGIRS